MAVSRAKRNRQLRRRKRQWLQKEKERRQCEECRSRGLSHKSLEYHHLEPKVDNVARMVRQGWARLKAEVSKCQVLCVGCHMEVDPQRKGR